MNSDAEELHEPCDDPGEGEAFFIFGPAVSDVERVASEMELTWTSSAEEATAMTDLIILAPNGPDDPVTVQGFSCLGRQFVADILGVVENGPCSEASPPLHRRPPRARRDHRRRKKTRR